MKVVVTGGNGRVGRYVVAELARSGPGQPAHDVTIFDRHRRSPTPSRVRQHVGDHSDKDALMRAFEGAGAVLHLAACQPKAEREKSLSECNVQGTQNVFEAAAQSGVKRVVNWSSAWALGWSTPGNSFLPDYLPIDEAHPLRATDPYGRSKIEGEAIASAFHGRAGLEVVTLRPVFTATETKLEELWGTKHRRRVTYSHLSYVDARDHATAARLALESPIADYVAAYIAADDSRVAEPLCELLPALNPAIGDRAESLTGTTASISNRLAKEVLGWHPRHSWRNLDVAQRARGVSKAVARDLVRRVAPDAVVSRWQKSRR